MPASAIMGDPQHATLYTDQRMARGELHPFAGGEVVVFSTARPGVFGPNEDAAALLTVDEQRGVLAVADGAGGLPDGARAARLAVESMAEAVAEAAPETTLREAILEGFERANRAVLALANGAATTLAVVAVNGDRMRPFHAGDSMVMVSGGRGKLKLETLSHSPTGYAVEAGILEAEDAINHSQRHVISNWVGARDMRIDVGSILRLAPRDTVVLGTDGLFDNLDAASIAEQARTGSLEQCADRLAEICLRRMAQPTQGEPSKPDDLTFVLFRRRRPLPG